VFHRSCPARAAVADEPGRLVVPLGEEEIDRVLERAADAVVVLRRHEDVAVEGSDLRRPLLRVLLGVLTLRRRHRLVEQRQVEIPDVHQLELGIGPLPREIVSPPRDGLADAPGTCASNDDCELEHGSFPLGKI
jgi:hypothetical protein